MYFGLTSQAVENHREEWFECQKEAKYLGDEYVNELRLQFKFPYIYETMCNLGYNTFFRTKEVVTSPWYDNFMLTG